MSMSLQTKFFILSGSFIQLLRYTAPPDARRTTVRLRSDEPASLVFGPNPSLKNITFIPHRGLFL